MPACAHLYVIQNLFDVNVKYARYLFYENQFFQHQKILPIVALPVW